MTDEYIKHLEMIQGVISRLAENSFKYKGLSTTLVSALLALAAKDERPGYALVGLLPAVCFWWLDAYYLCQERLFRRLYDQVRAKGLASVPPATDFSMRTSAPPCDDAEAQRYSVVGVAFSKTIAWLYIPLILVVVVVAVIVWAVGPVAQGH
jgi:hypothetical protein